MRKKLFWNRSDSIIMGYGLIKVLNNKMSFILLNELNLKKLNDHC